jgi:hypothetical protein
VVNDDASTEQTARALRDYVAAHPHAADSARGIREWWLAGMVPPPTPDQVVCALLRLEDEGLFARAILPDGSELWRALSRG